MKSIALRPPLLPCLPEGLGVGGRRRGQGWVIVVAEGVGSGSLQGGSQPAAGCRLHQLAHLLELGRMTPLGPPSPWGWSP